MSMIAARAHTRPLKRTQTITRLISYMIDLLLIPLMATLSRMIGAPHGGIFKWVYPIPFGLITYVLSTNAGFIAPMLSAGFALLGKKVGHGRGISLGEPMNVGSKPEKVEWPILWLQPHMSVCGYKSLILTMCEALVWLGIAMTVSPWLILGAICRPLAYNIGWMVWRHAENNGHIRRTKVNDHSEVYISYLPNFIGQPTQIGELLTGAFNGVILAVLCAFY